VVTGTVRMRAKPPDEGDVQTEMARLSSNRPAQNIMRSPLDRRSLLQGFEESRWVGNLDIRGKVFSDGDIVVAAVSRRFVSSLPRAMETPRWGGRL